MLARAQLTFLAAILVPTMLSTALGIVMLVVGGGAVDLTVGVLLLAFTTTTLTGYTLGSTYLRRGASFARVQNDFVSSVSHELRTPLTSIRMFIETLKDRRITDPDEQQKCLELLHREVERMDGLINRVIEISRWETGRHALEMAPIEVSEFIKEAHSSFEAASMSRPVEVRATIGPDVYVSGNLSSLSLAISNLLNNAWKYGAETENLTIRIRTLVSEKEVELVVADNGPGIPKAGQASVFEQFERGQAAIDSRVAGSGLGLAIVRAIVQAHDGKISLNSKEGQGAEFHIKLPRRKKS